jgi:hypothetical protein
MKRRNNVPMINKGEPALCIVCHDLERSKQPNGQINFGGKGCEAIVCGSCTQKLMHKTRDIPWDGDFKELKEKAVNKYRRLG